MIRKLFLLLLFPIFALAALPANAQQVKTKCPNGESPILQTVDTSDGRFVQPLCVDSSGKLDVNIGSVNGAVALKPSSADSIQHVTNGGSDTNDGLSWGTAKLTVAAACAAFTGGNTSCTAGTGTVFVSPAFTGTIPSVATGGTVDVVVLTPLAMQWLTGGGAFNNTTNVSAHQFSANGVNVTTLMGAIQGGKITDALDAVMEVPAASTANQADAFGAYTEGSSTTTNAQGAYAQCRTLVNNVKCWGAGSTATNSSTTIPGLLTGFEADIFDNNTSATTFGARGIALGIQTALAGKSEGAGVEIDGTTNGANGAWQQGIQLGVGAVKVSNIAMKIQANGVATASANFGAPLIEWDENWWNGTASQQTNWIMEANEGASTNPTSDTFLIQAQGVIPGSQIHNVGLTTTAGSVRLGVGTATPGFALDAVGDVNTSTMYRVGGNPLILSGSVSGSIIALAANTCSDTITATITGATSSMAVYVSPNSDPGVLLWKGWVSAANTVTIQYCNPTTTAQTPNAITFQIRVIQ